MLARFGPVREPGEWCVADVFQAVTAFLGGADCFEPGKAYGFLYAPKGVTERRTVKASNLMAAAAKLDRAEFIPPSIAVGDTEIGPADFLFAALEVLETGAEEVVVFPRDQLGDIAGYLPKMAKLTSFKGTWIYDRTYEDKWTSNRLKWQFWTFRYE